MGCGGRGVVRAGYITFQHLSYTCTSPSPSPETDLACMCSVRMIYFVYIPGGEVVCGVEWTAEANQRERGR